MAGLNDATDQVGTDNSAKDRRPRLDGQPESFEIDARVSLMVDFDLCVALGRHLLATGTENPALYAMGITLKKMGDARKTR